MIHPKQLPVNARPPIVAKVGLLSNEHHWGYSDGLLAPFIKVDPLVRFQAGYMGLIAHEELHCVERHSFWKVSVGAITTLLTTILAVFSITLSGEQAVACAGATAGVLVGGVGYLAWFLRESEVRADTYALELVGVHGMYAFLLMVGHPAVADGPMIGPMKLARRFGVRAYRRWLRWVYAPTINDRIARAAKRQRRLGWPLSEVSLSVNSRSASSVPMAAPTSK